MALLLGVLFGLGAEYRRKPTGMHRAGSHSLPFRCEASNLRCAIAHGESRGSGFGSANRPGTTTSGSGRAAHTHIGFAAADHALGGGLGGGLVGRRAGAVFEIGHGFGVAAAEPGFRADRQQRQRLGQIIDRPERMQRAGAGDPDLINPRGDRRFEIFAAPGPGISLPFAPGRNHVRPLVNKKSLPIASKLTAAASNSAALQTLYRQMVPGPGNDFRMPPKSG